MWKNRPELTGFVIWGLSGLPYSGVDLSMSAPSDRQKFFFKNSPWPEVHFFTNIGVIPGTKFFSTAVFMKFRSIKFVCLVRKNKGKKFFPKQTPTSTTLGCSGDSYESPATNRFWNANPYEEICLSQDRSKISKNRRLRTAATPKFDIRLLKSLLRLTILV